MNCQKYLTITSFVNLSIFIFFVLGMVIQGSYNYAIILLLLVSIYTVSRYYKLIDFKQSHSIVLLFLLYACTVIIVNLVANHGARDYESPARFLLAIPIIYAMSYVRLNRLFLMVCIALGGVAMGLLALYEVHFLHIDRAGLYYIRFGDIGILTAFFCIAGLIFFPHQEISSKQQLFLKTLSVLGIVGGLTASILSGTRGGWVLPILAIPFLCFIVFKNAKQILGKVAIIGVVVLGASFLIPQTNVKNRVMTAVSEVENYQPNTVSAQTSVGGRLEMWRLAVKIIQERPWTGWGLSGYRERMQVFVKNQEAAPTVLHRHPHNEILNEATKRGILSAIIVIFGLYLFMFSQFFRKLHSQDPQIRYYASLGCLTIWGWISFGLTDVFLEHNQMMIYYIFYMAVFLGGIRDKSPLCQN